MPQRQHPHFFQSLRFKLLLASLSLLLIPWAGYHYLLEMESSLRQAQEALLSSRAEIVANMLAADSDNWLPETGPDGNQTANSLYVHPLENPPDIDGYAEDWLALKSQSRRFDASASRADAVSFDWLAGFHAGLLYLMIEIRDERLVYPRSDKRLNDGDHLILALPGPAAKARLYLLGTSAPGWINAIEAGSGREQSAIRGEWQESPQGYRLELRVPRSLANGRLSLAVVDIDQPGAAPAGIASTSGWRNNDNLALLVMPTLQTDRLLQGLDSQTHRYSILNLERQVIGRHGSISPAIDIGNNPLSRLFSLLISVPTASTGDSREKLGRLDGPEIRRALSGEGGIYRYQLPGSKVMTLSAAHPILVDDRVTGTVVVEQTTREILLLQQSASDRLLLISLMLFVITGGALLLFASSLTRRITRLNRKYHQAVSKDGRIVHEVSATRDRDELGELDRSLRAVLQRSKAYTAYLESMASRLAHEFRTPLTIVQSSLENIQNDSDRASASPYVKRALEGTRRLNLILTRLREATRLEQALQGAELVDVDITGLCRSLCRGYAGSYRQIAFDCQIPDHAIQARLAPELISQALDKLVSNAVDFHRPRTAICIELATREGETATILVRNQGPPLADEIKQRLFDSMVSLRNTRDDQPHLGLGLYLVRLIAEFHQGRTWAANEDDGVCFAIDLPCRTPGLKP
ncbi:MAG: histidine kinase [Candidatus Thiodiazotropha sp. (ex Dulcina madagascariensis)]|nr:histidine kinase [Candidatus Thiodiazotropha sp. (ex Dulcina madagascariensis)]MCU7926520.1 histidine kinase [Candidatus Thiodiazotropha sp. (ex Dulcina madagascariensis)]